MATGETALNAGGGQAREPLLTRPVIIACVVTLMAMLVGMVGLTAFACPPSSEAEGVEVPSTSCDKKVQ